MIKVQATTKVLGPDLLKRIKQAVERADGCCVEVGWPRDERYPGHPEVSTGQVALWNEYGTYHAPVQNPDAKPGEPEFKNRIMTPARPFMRPALDENHARIEALRDQQIQNVAFRGWTVEKGLTQMGMQVVEMIRNKIKSNVPPENAESTLARKKKEGVAPKTLINTGRMLGTLGFKVNLSPEVLAEKEAKHEQEPPTLPAATGGAGHQDRKAARVAAREAAHAKKESDAATRRAARAARGDEPLDPGGSPGRRPRKTKQLSHKRIVKK